LFSEKVYIKIKLTKWYSVKCLAVTDQVTIFLSNSWLCHERSGGGQYSCSGIGTIGPGVGRVWLLGDIAWYTALSIRTGGAHTHAAFWLEQDRNEQLHILL
jgi:hypothetical protein